MGCHLIGDDNSIGDGADFEIFFLLRVIGNAQSYRLSLKVHAC